jgi:ribonuclease J
MNSFDLSGVKITPFKISNCFPNSLGFIFSTNNENVIYTDDSIVCSSKATVISNDILSIIPLISDKNNILLTTVGQVSKVKGFASPSFQTQEYFKDIFNENSSRVIIGLYSFEIYKITSILNAASLTGRTVVFHNSKTADIIKKMGEYKLIDLSKYKIEPISYLLQNPSESIVVIIDQVPNLFFNTMSDICDEQFPELIIGKNDSYYFCSQTIKGYEKKEADLFDTINKCEVKLSSKIDSKYIDLKPGDEDIKFITAFMKPMYIFPVSGLYMEFVNYQNTISKTGFKKKNMIILSNGQNVTFNDGVLDANISFVQLDPKLVNIQGGVDENNSSLLERIQMKDNGAIVIGYIINNNTKKIVDSKYDNIGVVSQPQDVNTLNGIFNKTTTDLSNLLPEFLGENDRLNTKEFKLSVRKNVVSKISKVFDKRPLVMVTILFE